MLDADVQATADDYVRMLPAPLHTLGVAAARQLLNTPPGIPPRTPVHSAQAATIHSDDHDIAVRVYRPSSAQDLPALVYLHGGGWVLGGLDGADELCRTLSVSAACVVISVDYRLAPEHPFPAGLDDSITAFDWTARSAPDLGIDRSRIAIGGDSAGANLAIAVCMEALRTGSPLPCFQLLAYPPTDFGSQRRSWTEYGECPPLTAAAARWFMSLYVPDENDRRNPLVSPEQACSLAGMPPTHIVTAEVDVLRDDSEAFAERLHADGVAVTATRYPGVCHGFFTEVGTFTRTTQAIDDAVGQLRKAWRESSARH